MEVLSSALKGKKSNFYMVLTLFLIAFIAVFIFGGDLPINSSIEAMVVFGTTVMPVLLPFSTLILLTNYAIDKTLDSKHTSLYKVLKYIFIITAGCPTGAKTAVLLHEQGAPLSPCTRLAIITSIASPLVIINCVGRLTFNSTIFGVVMFLSQLLSAKITADLTLNTDEQIPNLKYPKDNLSSALKENLTAVLTSATLTLLCYTVAKITVDCLPINILRYPLLVGALFGFVETNYAMKWFSLVISPLSIALANSTLIFGGAPLILQMIIFCRKLKMRTLKVLKIKLFESALCFILTYFFMLVFFFLAL